MKLVSEMSKKMLPTASTLTRAVVDGRLGTVIVSVPSFAVLASRTVGKEFPQARERKILTLAQLTGAAVVLATFHVTVCDEPVVHTMPVFGCVTLNGPLAPSTVTVEVAVLIPPPLARLSRAT